MNKEKIRKYIGYFFNGEIVLGIVLLFGQVFFRMYIPDLKGWYLVIGFSVLGLNIILSYVLKRIRN